MLEAQGLEAQGGAHALASCTDHAASPAIVEKVRLDITASEQLPICGQSNLLRTSGMMSSRRRTV